MSNDTQIAAHNDIDWVWVGKLTEAADSARSHGFSVGTTNWGAHIYRAVQASARQLSEQPGFVMVPVEVVKFLTGEGPLDGLWFGENPFGLGGGKYWWRKHLFTARPLTASPTAPSTEASEPVRDEPLSWNCTNGCGSCGVKLVDFVKHAEILPDGTEVPILTEPQIVSTCCGSDVEVWDERKQDITATVAARALKGTP